MNFIEWISFIGVIVGIPAGIWSIIVLFKKDAEREREIKSFEKIATESAKQAKHLSEQVKEMQESNKFTADQAKKIEDKEKREKEAIKPNFIVGNIGLDNRLQLASIALINEGELANFKDIIVDEINTVKVNYYNLRTIHHGGKIDLQLNPTNTDIKIEQCVVSFSVIYLDENLNKYSQKVEGTIKKGKIKILPPIEIL